MVKARAEHFSKRPTPTSMPRLFMTPLSMLKAMHLKLSSSAGQPHVSVPLQPSITIFVGPNNSGKSLLLNEIRNFCKAARQSNIILDHFAVMCLSREEIDDIFQNIKQPFQFNECVEPGHSVVTLGADRHQVNDEEFYHAGLYADADILRFARFYLKSYFVTLDGATRINHLGAQGRGDLKYPTHALPKMFVDDVKRSKWQAIVNDAFQLYPGIDATEGDVFSVKFGRTPPLRERTLEADIIDWMRGARPITAVSDGVKAFAGIMLEIYAGDPKIIMIDEPEAFLHPSLSRILGKELATAARTEGKFVFAATHSADFVMGAVQSGAVVNIVRLTYSGGTASARLLPNAELRTLMNDPMLRSVGVLSGLFFQNVVVTEADADRAFYQEINERLIAARDPRGIPHALFLNADNHQTIPRIMAPLRKLGIATAGIYDLDVIKLGGDEWRHKLESASFPRMQQQSNLNLRKTVHDLLKSASPSNAAKPDDFFKTNGGISLLVKDDLETARNFCDDLDRYGMFLVRDGEVEAWLTHLGAPSKSNGWRAAIFEAMGSDPEKPSYLLPTNGDVWDFIGSVAKWMNDPQRRGIPE